MQKVLVQGLQLPGEETESLVPPLAFAQVHVHLESVWVEPRRTKTRRMAAQSTTEMRGDMEAVWWKMSILDAHRESVRAVCTAACVQQHPQPKPQHALFG